MSTDAYSEVVEEQSHGDQSTWQNVYDAIVDKWSQIQHCDLEACGKDLSALVAFIGSKTDTAEEEIKTFVAGIIPQATNLFQEVGASARLAATRVKDTAQAVYQRTGDEISECPMRAASVALVTGFAIGAFVTTLYFQSRPEPTVWQSVRNRRWNH